MNEQAMVVRESYGVVNFEEYAMNVEAVTRQVNMIQEIMRAVMTEGEHFGTIPGCQKPSLYKPGAEKLNMTFRLRPEYDVRRTDLPGAHREYEVVCTLYHIPTGQIIGQGVGSATTMEGKYRFRGGEKEGTGQPIPKEYWNLKNAGKMDEARALIGGPGFAPGKIDGKWEICEIGEKVEHDNPADYYNTVLKMAKKRAHVDAILTATAASDIFTQDVEDRPEVIPGAKEAAKKDEKPPLKEPQKKSKEQPPETVTITVKEIDHKDGVNEKTKEPYRLYKITAEDGTVYGTFSDTFADMASTAKQTGGKVTIEFHAGKYGNTIRNLQPVETDA